MLSLILNVTRYKQSEKFVSTLHPFSCITPYIVLSWWCPLMPSSLWIQCQVAGHPCCAPAVIGCVWSHGLPAVLCCVLRAWILPVHRDPTTTDIPLYQDIPGDNWPPGNTPGPTLFQRSYPWLCANIYWDWGELPVTTMCPVCGCHAINCFCHTWHLSLSWCPLTMSLISSLANMIFSKALQ